MGFVAMGRERRSPRTLPIEGAFKVGSKDDLVTALGLALQDDGPERAWIYVGD